LWANAGCGRFWGRLSAGVWRAKLTHSPKEASNDAGLASHPSGRFDVNHNFFQMAMLAYNLNCWLMRFNREEQDESPPCGTL
jgi:hypothetical protein